MTNPSAKYLYLFLDESGDFNFSATGTKYFTFTAITKGRPFAGDEPLSSLKYDLIECGFAIECFHAAEDRQIVRDKVFQILSNNLGTVRIDSLIIEKRKTGPALLLSSFPFSYITNLAHPSKKSN
jgi:hypothetical protein